MNPGFKLRDAGVRIMVLRGGDRLRRGGSGWRCRRSASGCLAGDRRRYGEGVRRPLECVMVVDRCRGSRDLGRCGRCGGGSRRGR